MMKPNLLNFDDPVINTITKGRWEDFTFLELECCGALYEYSMKYIAQSIAAMPNFPGTPSMSSYSGEYNYNYLVDDDVSGYETEKQEKKMMLTRAGCGVFTLEFQQKQIYALNKIIGLPVGLQYEVETYKTLIFFTQGRNELKLLEDFVEHIAQTCKQEVSPSFFEVYKYNVLDEYWKFFYHARGRAVESVILPEDAKRKILEDVSEFSDGDTKRWYFDKGIPYKRSYLFYGIPGCGKTSMISVIAATYKRPVCYINLTHEKMSDEKVKGAIQSCPSKGIIVFEDVDALFTSDRKSMSENHLTFSGLLNALDGIGSGLGQIFILTTNHRDRLDQALLRNGRVDLQIHFTYATPKQMVEMFRLFYPDSSVEMQEDFATQIVEGSKLISNEPCVTAAMLQNFFIANRKVEAQEALTNVNTLLDDLLNSRTNSEKEETKKLAQQQEKSSWYNFGIKYPFKA